MNKVYTVKVVNDSKAFNPVSIDSPRYFDSAQGDDANDGRSPSTPWKNLNRINDITWLPGSSIYIKAGSEWEGQIALRGSGTLAHPIVLSSYGEGNKPYINGTGKRYTIKIENQEFWEISNLDITNYNESEEAIALKEWENHNKTHWAEASNLPQYKAKRKSKSAILVMARDYGEMAHLHFINLEIHGVNGDISDKDNGGIFLEISGNTKPTWFSDVVIESCYIHDVDRTGISNRSSWNKRSLTNNTNWTPTKKIVIRNNRFERTGANALIVRVAHAPLMEYNLFDHCAIKESGNASFAFNCDSALWQYNEARFTKYNEGDIDAGGFDSDYRCKHTTFRYNYSHDNEHGGILICCYGGNNTRFNYGTIICYNLFANNRNHVFRVSGIPNETYIFNNVIYNSDDAAPTKFIWHKNWNGYPTNTHYYNNIFYSRTSTCSINLSSSTENDFQNNIFWRLISGDLPVNQIDADPLFSGEDYNGTPSVDFYKIKKSSPAINVGKKGDNTPKLDYYGNTISSKSNPDVGIHELK